MMLQSASISPSAGLFVHTLHHELAFGPHLIACGSGSTAQSAAWRWTQKCKEV